MSLGMRRGVIDHPQLLTQDWVMWEKMFIPMSPLSGFNNSQGYLFINDLLVILKEAGGSHQLSKMINICRPFGMLNRASARASFGSSSLRKRQGRWPVQGIHGAHIGGGGGDQRTVELEIVFDKSGGDNIWLIKVAIRITYNSGT
jgi:hypothetical protein